MTDQYADVETALDRVLVATREHYRAVREYLAAQSGATFTDDSRVWRAYVELNNASLDYDELLQEAFGEITPWNVEAIDPDEALRRGAPRLIGPDVDDPHPTVLSVRHRRDYRVPSGSALLRAADLARRSTLRDRRQPVEPVRSVAEAVLELMQAGDGSLGSLDVPELESCDGVVIVAEVGVPLNPSDYADCDATGPFALHDGDRIIDRVDEHAFSEPAAAYDEDDEDLVAFDLHDEDPIEDRLPVGGPLDDLDDDDDLEPLDEDSDVDRPR